MLRHAAVSGGAMEHERTVTNGVPKKEVAKKVSNITHSGMCLAPSAC